MTAWHKGHERGESERNTDAKEGKEQTREKTRGQGLINNTEGPGRAGRENQRKERIKGENRTSKHRKEGPGRTDRERPGKKRENTEELTENTGEGQK